MKQRDCRSRRLVFICSKSFNLCISQLLHLSNRNRASLIISQSNRRQNALPGSSHPQFDTFELHAEPNTAFGYKYHQWSSAGPAVLWRSHRPPNLITVFPTVGECLLRLWEMYAPIFSFINSRHVWQTGSYISMKQFWDSTFGTF